MMPSTIGHDLMQANEAATIRATRYAHHRAQTYRRAGPFLASLLRALTSKLPALRHVRAPAKALTGKPPDPLCLAVVDLGSDDIGGALDVPAPPSLIA